MRLFAGLVLPFLVILSLTTHWTEVSSIFVALLVSFRSSLSVHHQKDVTNQYDSIYETYSFMLKRYLKNWKTSLCGLGFVALHLLALKGIIPADVAVDGKTFLMAILGLESLDSDKTPKES